MNIVSDEWQLKEINLKRMIAFKEFKEKGYEEELKKLGIIMEKFNFVAKSPLHKNPNAFGINRQHETYLEKNKKILIVAMHNPLSLKTHNFYIFDINNPNDIQFLSGIKNPFRYIHYRMKNYYLRSIEDFINNRDLRVLDKLIEVKKEMPYGKN